MSTGRTVVEYHQQARAEIDHAIAKWVAHIKDPDIRDATQYVVSGGKRVRGTMCILTAECLGGDRATSVDAACAVEISHSISLSLDDLPSVDNDIMRRGQPSAWVKYGVGKVTLLSHILMPHAQGMLEKYGAEAERAFARTWETVSWGEFRDVFMTDGVIAGARRALAEESLAPLTAAISGKMYETIIGAKTAALFRLACTLGALSARAPDRMVGAAGDYGHACGVAFQIADDVCDLALAEHSPLAALTRFPLLAPFLPWLTDGQPGGPHMIQVMGKTKILTAVHEAERRARTLPQSEYRDMLEGLPGAAVAALMKEVNL